MRRRVLTGMLLLAALLSLGWWILEWMQPRERIRETAVESPTYYAHQLNISSYDEEGRLVETLRTPLMIHYDSRGATEFSEPLVWRYNPDEPPWRLQAEQAVAHKQADTIFMSGEVIIDRNADINHSAYHIVTQDLTVRSKDGYATTEQPVRIESKGQWTTAIGMQGWLKQPVRVHLLHQVRGEYVFE